MKKKWQLAATIIGLLVVVVAMNSVADQRQQKARELAKQAEKARQAAELQAAQAHGKPVEEGAKGKPAFDLPGASGPATAPVKLEIFINNSNTCHTGNVPQLKELPGVYGALLRVEWLSMLDPKLAERSDKLQIACDAGLVINGKLEHKIERMGGKQIVVLRGPVGDKYKLADVYAAINAALQEKGKTVPAAAKGRAK